MAADYLSELRYMGLISRIKRLSDSTLADGRKLYHHIDIGIEPNWFLIFRILIEKGETSISEISATLNFSHPSIISIVKKMQAAGYLKIEDSQTDKRKQIISMSAKATKQLPEMQKVWNACELAVKSVFKNDNFITELEKMEKSLADESFFDRVLSNLDQEKNKL